MLPPRLYTVSQVAALTGFPSRSIYALIYAGEVKSVRTGVKRGGYRISEDEVRKLQERSGARAVKESQ